MVDSTPSGDVVDQSAARAPEPVVEREGGGQGQEALGDASAQVVKGAGAVALEGEDVLAGPEDRLDPLADRSEVDCAGGPVLASRPCDRGLELSDRFGEAAAGVALVADEDLPTDPVCTFEQLDPHLALVALGGGEREGAWGSVRGEQPVQAEAPEEARVRSAVAVVGGVTQGRAPCRLHRASALDRSRVDEQQVVVKTGTLRGEDGDQPLAWATQSVAISASVTRRRALPGFSGRRSSAVQST